jgi:hypothetical protein
MTGPPGGGAPLFPAKPVGSCPMSCMDPTNEIDAEPGVLGTVGTSGVRCETGTGTGSGWFACSGLSSPDTDARLDGASEPGPDCQGLALVFI